MKFLKSINIYWKNKIENIPKDDTTKIFPKFNRIFKKKDIAEINTLKVPYNSPMLNKANINLTQYKRDDKEKILINNLPDKLNVMGAYFASINNKIYDNDRPQFNELIYKTTNSFIEQIESEKINNIMYI